MISLPQQPIGLVLADPHPVMLDGLQKDLQEWPQFKIHTCAKDGDAALRAIHEHRPDLIVLDLPLAKRSGLALIQELQLQDIKTQPIVFTGAPIGDVMRVIDMGVKGLVSKSKSKEIKGDHSSCYRQGGHSHAAGNFTGKSDKHSGSKPSWHSNQ